MKDHSTAAYENLCWIDIETTGLDPRLDAILEVGIAITDKNLDLIAQYSWSIIPSMSVNLLNIDTFVWQMHVDNGLWDEAMASTIPLDAALLEAEAAIKHHGAEGSPMCGSTINFDRGFLKVQAPEFLRCLHYRNIDVSTLKNVMSIHFDHLSGFPKIGGCHRAGDDILASIAEYEYYLDIIKCGAGEAPSV